MRKIRQLQLGCEGQTHFYHVISRTTGRDILFNFAEKEAFVEILQKRLRFSGLQALAWCFMGNHFHLLLEVPDQKSAIAELSDEQCFARLKILDDEVSTQLLIARIAQYRRIGNLQGLGEIAEGIRKRLFSLSAFMKEFKMKMTEWYNRRHQRVGTLWETRFKSMLVEGNRALQAVSAYIDLNPLRAKLVQNPLEYRWCSYSEAARGNEQARQKLSQVMERETEEWEGVVADYRLLLYGLGQEKTAGTHPDGVDKAKGGFTREEIEAVWKNGGALSDWPLTASVP